ncbi:PAS domain-containing sensor histidine kinase [Oxalobacteraceae bacterium CAVE-383]|nr:PAS domain-containing sensor histidine kinase [Oxalobacteraceae bacterium CAVE-383]
MLTLLIPHSPRNVALGVAISGAAGAAGLLEPVTGSLGLICVVLSAHFFGRPFGRLAATFASLGIATTVLASTHPPLVSGPIGPCAVAIAAVWLCAELVSRRPTQPGSTAGLKDAPDDEQIYRRIVDNLPACVCVGGPTGELLYVNKVGVTALGRPMAEILGDGWMACLHPDDAHAAKQQWKARIAAHEPVDINVRMLQHDGVYRWQRLLAEPSTCSNGDVPHWYLIAIEIEETVKVQQALAASEKEARELLDRIPGRFATRTEQDFDFVNQQILDETKTTLTGMQNLGFLRYIHPDDRDRVKEGYLRSVQDKTAYDTTYRWADQGDNYRWRHSRSVPYFNADGSVYKWYAVNMDIDDLYRSKEIVREREAQLYWLTENVPLLLWRTDSHGHLEYVNKRTEDYTGLRQADLIAGGWLHLVHPDDFASTMEAWQDSINSGRPYESANRFRAADNTYCWFQCQSIPMRDANGDIVNWYGVCTDINDLKQTEAVLEQREYQLQKLTETIPAMLWCNDPEGGLTYINGKTSEFLGLGLSQLADLGYEKTIHPDDMGRLAHAWAHSIKTGEPYCHTARLRRKDGVYRWYQHTAEAMRNSGGNIVQWYGLSFDIDEPKRAEDRLRQTQAELARATQIATVAELSASIAHELNQPLTSVIANAQACKRWLAASPPNLTEVMVSVESVIRDARSADETMQSIRALFKRQTLQKQGRNVKDMVLEAVRLLREDETKRTADIAFDLPDGLPPVFVDQIQIQQVLLNLIMNGIEATENTGRTPKILIAARALEDRSVLLDVIDNGSGIVGDDSIFDAFITTKNKGMGIGLAVSRSIIEAHEGRLTAVNNAGYGATFSVVLAVLPAQISRPGTSSR